MTVRDAGAPGRPSPPQPGRGGGAPAVAAARDTVPPQPAGQLADLETPKASIIAEEFEDQAMGIAIEFRNKYK